MDILKYVKDLDRIPIRFSNFDFWRSVRYANSRIRTAFEYLNLWGTNIETELDSQRQTDVQLKSDVDAVGTSLSDLSALVYDAKVANFKINTFTDTKAVITELATGLYTVATTNSGKSLPTPPFHVTSRASIYVYTDAEHTSQTLVDVPMAVIVTMVSGKTCLLWQPTPFYAPYGVKNLMGLYTTYITHV